jgi:hypothetical protein
MDNLINKINRTIEQLLANSEQQRAKENKVSTGVSLKDAYNAAAAAGMIS